MARIWTNCIEKGTKQLSSCPDRYFSDVMNLLYQDTIRQVNGMTPEKYEEITGDPFPVDKA